jgi:hypothetical protein
MDGQRTIFYEAIALLSDLRTLEGEFGELLDVEEVWALEMAVALIIAGIYAGCHDVDVDSGFRDIAGIVVNGPIEIAERAGNVTDHQVADGETDSGVRFVQVVGIGEQKRAAKKSKYHRQ